MGASSGGPITLRAFVPGTPPSRLTQRAASPSPAPIVGRRVIIDARRPMPPIRGAGTRPDSSVSTSTATEAAAVRSVVMPPVRVAALGTTAHAFRPGPVAVFSAFIATSLVLALPCRGIGAGRRLKAAAASPSRVGGVRSPGRGTLAKACASAGSVVTWCRALGGAS